MPTHLTSLVLGVQTGPMFVRSSIPRVALENTIHHVGKWINEHVRGV